MFPPEKSDKVLPIVDRWTKLMQRVNVYSEDPKGTNPAAHLEAFKGTTPPPFVSGGLRAVAGQGDSRAALLSHSSIDEEYVTRKVSIVRITGHMFGQHARYRDGQEIFTIDDPRQLQFGRLAGANPQPPEPMHVWRQVLSNGFTYGLDRDGQNGLPSVDLDSATDFGQSGLSCSHVTERLMSCG